MIYHVVILTQQCHSVVALLGMHAVARFYIEDAAIFTVCRLHLTILFFQFFAQGNLIASSVQKSSAMEQIFIQSRRVRTRTVRGVGSTFKLGGPLTSRALAW